MFFLVTGASGAGKSTVRKVIEGKLRWRVEAFELATPGVAPEWSLRWRHQAVERAIQTAVHLQRTGTHYLLCGDPVPPGELYAAPGAGELDRIEVCLLDVSKEKQIERLRGRGDAPDLIPRHVAFAEWMRHHVADHRHRPEVIINGGWEQMRWDTWTSKDQISVPWRSRVIDTTNLEPTATAEQVLRWIESHIASPTPPSFAPHLS